MRAFLVSATLLALGVAACGAITGVGAYADGTGDGSVGATGDDDGATVRTGNDGGGGDDLTDDAVATDVQGDDAPAGEDGAGGEELDGGQPDDATNESPDVGTTPQEAGGTAHDAAVESGPPPCSTSTCGGCCSNGTCVGGQSAGTCGTGGIACKSCSGSTPVCSSAGACVAEPMEASAPTCTQSACATKTVCIPVYQEACCKSDGTCGCEVAIPPSNNCQ
jgi:hypothetical protein